MSRHFGALPGVVEGETFGSRQALRDAGVHLPPQAGISGSGKEGADSIVLSGGYEDDQDGGDVIVYTGDGGRDPVSGKQVGHQELVRGNLALAVSHRDGLPVRVIRKVQAGVYEYAGLYRVEDHWHEIGKSGFRIWRFRLVKTASDSVVLPMTEDSAVPRRPTLVQRVVRDTVVARSVKSLYGHRCQVCGERLETAAGPYAEAAHIRPLGAPHHGPDVLHNLLCLCPNHHVLFDFGAFAVGDDFELIGLPGRLQVHPRHRLDPAHLKYHRDLYLQLL